MPPNKKSTAYDKINIEEFTNDWNSGMSLVDLARKYNFSYPEKAKRIGQKLGLKKQKNLTFFDKFLKDSRKTNELITMYADESITISKITTHFGFTDNGYVSRLVKKIGITPRRGGQGSIEKFKESKNEFIEMWNDNVLKKIIAKKFNISYPTVSLWRKRLGLEPRSLGRIRPESLSEKIELLLLENLGALTTKEIKKILNISTVHLANCLNLEKIQRLSLTMHVTGRLYRKPSDYFGDYTGQSIVYLRGMNDSLILKLSKILQTGRMFKNNLLKKANYNFMISRLTESEKDIENRSQQLYGLIHFKNNQNKLESIVESQLKKYRIITNTSELISRIESNDSLIPKILSEKPKSKFYGRKFEPKLVIKELDSSYPDDQKRLVQEIFTPFNFICRTSNDEYFDLEITSDDKFLIKLILHQQLTTTSLKIFHNKLQGQKGIIINFESISESVKKLEYENISILANADLLLLLNSLEFLPVRAKSFAKITFGEDKEKIIFCENIDFETNIATVSDSDHNTKKILIKFLKQIELPENVGNSDYFNFIEKFKTISIIENISTMDECIVNVTRDILNRHGDILITSQVDSYITKISLLYNLFDEKIGDDHHVTSIGILRNKLIQCNCLSWESQDYIVLCKHSIALLFHLWTGDINKYDNVVGGETIENFLDYVNFLINYSIKIEEFWFEKIDGKKINHHLIHYAICNLIHENYKTTSFFLDCDIAEKIELENLMAEYKNEKIKLFESVRKLSSEQKTLLLNTLFAQFRDAYKN